MFMSCMVSTTIWAMARLRNHFLLEGMTNQGACLVLHFSNVRFERGRVLVPMRPLGVVGVADLPVFGRVVDAFLEPFKLFVPIDVQEELEDLRVVVVQEFLKGIDMVVAARPDFLRHEVVNAHDEHVFVVRAIEDGHLAPFGNDLVAAPQEIMRGLDFRWHLKALDGAALWIHEAEDAANRAVLAGRVATLQHDQQRAFVLRVHEILQFAQLLAEFFQLRVSLFRRIELAGEAGVDRVQLDRIAGPHQEFFAVIHGTCLLGESDKARLAAVCQPGSSRLR